MYKWQMILRGILVCVDFFFSNNFLLKQEKNLYFFAKIR